MTIDMESFGQEVEKLKQHIDSSRDLIGSDVADHVLNRFGSAHALDEYFTTTIRDMAVETLRSVCREMSPNGVVGTNNQAEIEGWNELYAIYRDWLKLVHQANGLSGFSFTHSSYMKSKRALLRLH